MNRLILVVGPSGAGKSSFVDRIVEENDIIEDIITCTTRNKREGEVEGNPYFFLTKEEFEGRIEKGFFIEWARVHDQLYGTPKTQIEEAWSNGRVCIMDIDVQGAKTFSDKYPEETRSIFILPPSIDVLRQRVLKRDGDGIKDLDLRMANAEKEVALAENFHFQLVNDEFSSAYTEFKKIIDEIIEKR